MRRWWKYGYWAWPWKDSHFKGPFFNYLGLGPWTLWHRIQRPDVAAKTWVEWNYDEWDAAFASSQDFLDMLTNEVKNDVDRSS